MLKLFRPVVLVASLVLIAHPVQAQDVDKEGAAEHFDRGAEFYEDGNLDAALVEFERAYELHPDYRLLYNLAQVQVERHDYVAARELFQRYLAEGADDISSERRERVDAELESLAKRVADITVRVNVEGATILVDDKEVGTSPLAGAVKVNAGKRKIIVNKRGYEPHSESLELAGQDRARLFVELVPEAAPTVVAAPSKPATNQSKVPSDVGEERQANYAPVWWSAGAAVLLGGVAGTFGYLAIDAHNTRDSELNRLPADRGRVDDLNEKVELYSWVSDGATIGAVVAAAIGVYYLAAPPMESVAVEQGDVRIVPSHVANGAAMELAF